MKKIQIISLIFAVLWMTGCDYNDKYFKGYDSGKITDVSVYDGEFTGTYPSEGYFTDETELQTAIDKMLKEILLYADKDYVANISVMYGDVVPGLVTADKTYQLAPEDYDSLGEEAGQPGKYDNFDDKMDVSVESYLMQFCQTKFASDKVGTIVSITYMFYATGQGASARVMSLKKNIDGWETVKLDVFETDLAYKLVADDYAAMGGVLNTPGYFTNATDVNALLPILLKKQYPYAKANQTAEVKYYLQANEKTAYFKYDGTSWATFNPYGDLELYTLVTADYDSMGEGTGQPGAYNNFDSKMDIDTYLINFCKTKFASLKVGTTVRITYKYYATGAGTTDQTRNYYKASATSWVAFADTEDSYTLTTADYASMGKEAGQPGKYNNFDKNMDINAYLTSFCKTKYPSAAVGHTVYITYAFYISSSNTPNETRAYQKMGSEWKYVEKEAVSMDYSYALAANDYEEMGGAKSEIPGYFTNANTLPAKFEMLMKQAFPYAEEGQTVETAYYLKTGNDTQEKQLFFSYDGSVWKHITPYGDTMEVIKKTAKMKFDGKNWLIDRLMGGIYRHTLSHDDYVLMFEWVKENKKEYLSTQNTTDEYYFGVSTQYDNINNNYNTWRNYYNINGEYTGLDDDAVQKIMDKRIAEGINLVLNKVTKKDTGLSYIVTYAIYGGRGKGDYKMTFDCVEDEDGEFTFNWIDGPTQ